MSTFGRRAFVRKFAEDVRASYWAIPSAFVVVAIILAMILSWVDHNPDMIPVGLPDSWLDRQGDGARQTLATIATAIIGVAGVMFSMTLVAVSFAADTFGPRLIGNFMRDRGTQVSFGILLGTFVYTMFILLEVRGAVDTTAPFVPQYSMLAAIVLMVVSVFTMIYYVHHVPEMINVSNIASDLGHRFSNAIRALIDERADMSVEQVASRQDKTTTDVTLKNPGYIQQLDRGALFEVANDQDWIIDVLCLPGTFASQHVPVLRVHSSAKPTSDQMTALRNTIETGHARTEDQATPFIADQFCEMIARALSPGFNDPFTAMNCLNWFHAGLLDALLYNGGLHALESQRVKIHFTDFGDLLGSFENAAPYTVTDRMARLRHLELTHSLLDHAGQDHPQRDRLTRLAETLDQPTEEITL